MKVVLKPSLLSRVWDRIKAARRDNREIDYILLTDVEYTQLRCETRKGEYRDEFELLPFPSGPSDTAAQAADAKLFTLQLRDPWFVNHPYYRGGPEYVKFARRGELFGCSVYVVPERFALC